MQPITCFVCKEAKSWSEYPIHYYRCCDICLPELLIQTSKSEHINPKKKVKVFYTVRHQTPTEGEYEMKEYNIEVNCLILNGHLEPRSHLVPIDILKGIYRPNIHDDEQGHYDTEVKELHIIPIDLSSQIKIINLERINLE